MTSLKDIIEELRNEIENNGQTLEEIKDNAGEWIDGWLPIYYSDIIEEWKNMPSEYNDRGSSEFGTPDEISIFNLMSLDLFMYYRDLFYEAAEELENEEEAAE